MVVYVRNIGDVRIVLEGLLHGFNALFILFISEKGNTLLVEDLGVVTVKFKGSSEVIDC